MSTPKRIPPDDPRAKAKAREERRQQLLSQLDAIKKEEAAEKKAIRVADQQRCAAAAPELLKIVPFHTGDCDDEHPNRSDAGCLRCFLRKTATQGYWQDDDYVLRLRLEEVDRDEDDE